MQLRKAAMGSVCSPAGASPTVTHQKVFHGSPSVGKVFAVKTGGIMDTLRSVVAPAPTDTASTAGMRHRADDHYVDPLSSTPADPISVGRARSLTGAGL